MEFPQAAIKDFEGKHIQYFTASHQYQCFFAPSVSIWYNPFILNSSTSSDSLSSGKVRKGKTIQCLKKASVGRRRLNS